MCPPVSPHKGASIVKSPRTMCVFLYGNAAARTFGRAHRHRPYGFVWWIVCGWFCLLVGKTVHMNQHHRCCTFVSPGLPTIGDYPGYGRGGGPMPSALYFLKSICVWKNHLRIIHSPRVVMMCDEKKYNPQGGSILICIITQGRQRCTCQPCAIESITPMG